MTFKDFLKEMNVDDADMTPAEYARYKKQKEMNPKLAAMKLAKQKELEARAAQEDDSKTPEQIKAEKLEAMAARLKARQAQRPDQNEIK